MAVLEHLGKGVQTPDDTIFSVRGNGRKFAAGLAARSVADPCDIVIVGDSVTELLYGAYVYRLRERFAHFNGGKVSPGWVNGAATGDDVTGGVNRLQPLAFRLTTGSYNSGGNNTIDEYGLGMYSFRLASGSVLTLQEDPTPTGLAGTWSDAVTATPEFATAIFAFTTHGTDAFIGTTEIRVDGVLVNTFDGWDTTNGLGVFESHHTYTWTGTQGPHTITITGAGGAPSWFDGVYLASDTETVRIWNAGNAGERFTDLLVEPSGFADPPTHQAIAAIDADAVIYAYGINDYSDTIPVLYQNIIDTVTNVRALCDDVSLGIAVPYATSARTDWPPFAGAMRRAAAVSDVPVLDLSWMLKTNASSTDPHALVGADDIHQSSEGGEFYADRFAGFLLGYSVNWVDLLNLAASSGGLTLTDIQNGLLTNDIAASFVGTGFSPALTLSKFDSGKAYLLLQHNRDDLSATTGLFGEISVNGRGATTLLGASGVNGLVGFRFRAPSTWTDTSAPGDIEFFNAAAASVAIAVRMTLLAGGGLKFPEMTPPAGAANNAILAARDVSGRTQFGVVHPDSSFHALSSDTFNDPDVDPAMSLQPTGALAVTVDRNNALINNATPLVTQREFLVSIALKAGTTVTNVVFFIGGTAAGTPTNWWYTLRDSARALLRQTADQTTTGTGTNTKLPKALTATWVCTYSGLYYLGAMFKATTVPSLMCFTTSAGNNPSAEVPIMEGQTADTALTTTAPNPAGAISNNVLRPWAWVT